MTLFNPNGLAHCLVVIPTYNEKENITEITEAVLRQGEQFDVLVVDDSSPDGTADLVRLIMEQASGRVHLLERKDKSGLGTAYLDGFRWGLEKKYEYFFEMDADFSHDPNDLPRLLKACQSGLADVAIGSRYTSGGKVTDWPMDRRILSYGASLYVRLITWMPVKDPTAGFICYRREVLQQIEFEKIKFVGYAFQIEMKFAAHCLGFRLVEVPITFTDRVKGSSKMHKNIITEAILGVMQMKWYSFFNSYR